MEMDSLTDQSNGLITADETLICEPARPWQNVPPVSGSELWPQIHGSDASAVDGLRTRRRFSFRWD